MRRPAHNVPEAKWRRGLPAGPRRTRAPGRGGSHARRALRTRDLRRARARQEPQVAAPPLGQRDRRGSKPQAPRDEIPLNLRSAGKNLAWKRVEQTRRDARVRADTDAAVDLNEIKTRLHRGLAHRELRE